ncbi:restriction endonuclease subunit S [Maribacter aquivivus]|uniref:restriction endonuclease subunit S n=1 Tax=Maribacter aquivivus TaxID=228958 RepID=UPI0024950025|nr:restriction endonuclease subunit S [Maribacter aquivivus]
MSRGFKEYLFEDIVSKEKGFLRGPFGGNLKKEIFVPKDKNTYKVYEQGVVLRKNIEIGKYNITEEYFNEKMYRFEVCPKDFLVSCSGANYGAIFQMPENIEKGVINQALLRIRLNNDLINDSYFDYFFSHHLVNQIIGKKGDSTIPNFPPVSVLKKLKVKIHSDVIYQKQIAKVLSDLDAKIEVNNKINQELEAMAKTLYDYWFVQFDFPDVHGKPYKSSGGKMVFNEALKREIPEGWEVKRLSDFADCNKWNRTKESLYDKINYLDTSSLTENVIESFQELDFERDKIPSRAQRIVSKNDILYSTVRPNQLHYGIVKRPIENLIASTGFAQIRSNDSRITNDFIYQILSQDYVSTRLQQIAVGSVSAYPSISHNDIMELRITLPLDDELINKATAIFQQYNDKVALNLEENQKLSELRDWLLPMLMNGQVKVA